MARRKTNVRIGGRIFSLFSNHSTKAKARRAAARQRRAVPKMLARVRRAPKGARSKWSVFVRDPRAKG